MEGEKVRDEPSPTLTTVGPAARARGRAKRGARRESCIVMAGRWDFGWDGYSVWDFESG